MQEPPPPVRLFVIRNGRLHPEYQRLSRLFEPIAKRAISSLIKSQGIGDVFRLYLEARKQEMDFNLASITPDFTSRPEVLFDRTYMRAVFEFGFQRARSGQLWSKTPPYFEPVSGHAQLESQL
jgi:hypothetical protein